MDAPDYNQLDNRSSPTKPYFIYGIVFLVTVGILAELLALLFGGVQAQQKAQMIITFLTPIIFALIALQQQQTHKLVNSQSIQVQKLIGERAYVAGVEAGTAAEILVKSKNDDNLNSIVDVQLSPSKNRQT